jgi:hypothetical protein
METLLDPNFEYPDLVVVAEAMVAGTISTKDACILARKVTGGEFRQTSIGRALVIGPQKGAKEALAELQAYANAHDQRTAERWSAFALIIEVQLGVGDLNPEAAPLGLSNALRVFEPCVRATGAQCPPEAVEFAIQIVDSILENPACTDPDLRRRLMATRDSFASCAPATNRGLRAWFKSRFG